MKLCKYLSFTSTIAKCKILKTKNVKLYFNQLNTVDNFNILSSGYIGGNFLQYDYFLIQKYLKNKGNFEKVWVQQVLRAHYVYQR